ncbi:hypothetical protein PHYBLDRAFT_163071 [Phycomyces blakesleeanus NRRL 1555(-)]|uniref:Transmembrane protein n=1 Tax=Phycomyces blakesleeanus (strain ATCC 8743b / DSM 1359 / FGSC 10004 / NBRC 33097 / NRRL 1555) TaxID=763407 RepID=A0A162V506_PHYB8|nr:hypothetical protein PHYBLDRAFT_163071 [Phycomyces blakesleeanus NRRL 1555(-)]OAD80022.1 hypothetical protein PHYBLDRAFT_163071 [Phycomyces blakesleeanus NRRL 1555(-)]|eukprot:XP_018298062.1 hypothetical protein PHYBLDRAFT_163071 [Phycomyces blakesleeanus NRRL 1555(-)]
MIIVLQSVIAYQNTHQASLLPSSDTKRSPSLAAAFEANQNEALEVDEATDRLNRIKWENIAFVGFQFWFVGMSFDATVNQNAAEVIALATMNVMCALLGALEVIDGRRWLSTLRHMNEVQGIAFATKPLEIAFYLEITLTVLLTLFAIAFAYLSYEVVREFGWVIYKKIGADVEIQSKLKKKKIFQFFVLALKFDIFIEFLVSCFYLVQFATKEYDPVWEIWFQLGATALMLPMLYFARMACVVVVQFGLVLRQTLRTHNFWYTWICFVLLGIVLAVTTGTLGAICMYNFGKNLKPYIQRGAKKQEHADNLKLSKQASAELWKIDED